MKKEYNFSKMRSRKNPYAKRLKKQISIRLGSDVLDYFKQLAEETDMPYQTLIDLYLRDCIAQNRKPSIVWSKSA